MSQLTSPEILLAAETLILIAVALWFFWRAVIKPDIVARFEERLNHHRVEIDQLTIARRADRAEIYNLREVMATDREEMSAEIAELRAVLAEWEIGMRLVFAQMKAAGLTPAWQPRERPARKVYGRTDGTMAGRIAAQFNIDEINALAYDIGILAEDFSGDTRIARSMELVELAARRGISAALLGRVNELRGKG
jgi:hypothetical protein